MVPSNGAASADDDHDEDDEAADEDAGVAQEPRHTPERGCARPAARGLDGGLDAQ